LSADVAWQLSAKQEANHQQNDLQASRSALEEVEARSKAVLPSGFYFAAAPYDGFLERTWNLRLSVMPQDKPVLVLRIVGREDVDEKIAQEFETKVREGLPGLKIFRGSFTP